MLVSWLKTRALRKGGSWEESFLNEVLLDGEGKKTQASLPQVGDLSNKEALSPTAGGKNAEGLLNLNSSD